MTKTTLRQCDDEGGDDMTAMMTWPRCDDEDNTAMTTQRRSDDKGDDATATMTWPRCDAKDDTATM